MRCKARLDVFEREQRQLGFGASQTRRGQQRLQHVLEQKAHWLILRPRRRNEEIPQEALFAFAEVIAVPCQTGAVDEGVSCQPLFVEASGNEPPGRGVVPMKGGVPGPRFGVEQELKIVSAEVANIHNAKRHGGKLSSSHGPDRPEAPEASCRRP